MPTAALLPTTASLLQRLGTGPQAASYSQRISAQNLPQPHWLLQNPELAAELGLDADFFAHSAALPLLAGQIEHRAEFHASAYSGHQFGIWAGQLGDGRALSLGALATPQGEQELQLKGAGLTPYSRHGDGRAVLRSSLREYWASEAMHALGIPSSRALSLVGSPLPVQREHTESAAVLCRTAPSFLRIGHIEHWAAWGLQKNDLRPLQTLLQGLMAQHFAPCLQAQQPLLAWLAEVVRRNAQLVAQWQAVGFCHGVLNTDNISLLGLSMDYGPYQWLDAYDPEHICNASDTQGRYRYSRQPAIMRWNLFALGQALLPALTPAMKDDETAAGEALIAVLEGFEAEYQAAHQTQMAAKLGLSKLDAAAQSALADLLKLLARYRCDWSLFWRRWAEALQHWSGASPMAEQAQAFAALRPLFNEPAAFEHWLANALPLWQQAAQNQPEAEAARAASLQANPIYVLRNHLAQEAIAAAEAGDIQPAQRLAQVLRQPYTPQAGAEAYAALPPAWASSLSISCSS